MRQHPQPAISARTLLLIQGALILTAISSAGQITLYGGLSSLLSQAWHVSAGMLGLCSTALYLGVGLAYVPGGQLTDRYGAGRVLSLSLLLIHLGCVLLVLRPWFWWILLWRVVIGLGMGATITASIGRAHRLGASSTLSQGLFGGAMQAGTALGTLLPPVLKEGGITWQGIFLFWGMAASLMTLLWLFLPECDRRPIPGKRRVRDAFRSAAVARLGLIHSATFGIGQAVAPWLVGVCHAQGLPLHTATLAGALLLLVGMMGRVLGGWWLRHLPARVLLRLGMVLTIGALGLLSILCLIPNIGWGKVIPILAVLVLLEVGCTLPYAAVQSQAGHVGTREALGPGTAQGVVSQLCAPMSALGPALIGWSATGGSFALPFGLLAAYALVTSFLVERRKHPLARRPETLTTDSLPTTSHLL